MVTMRTTFWTSLVGWMALGAPALGSGVEPGTAKSPESGGSTAAVVITIDARGWEELAASFGGAKAETKPSRDVVMGFGFPTEIRELTAVGGQKVKKGELLARARDAEVVAALERSRLLAGNDLEVRGAAAAQELAEFRFEQLKRGQSFSPSEFEELRIQALTAKVQHDQAKVNLQQRQYELGQLEGQYERFRLEAPFDGIVEEVLGEVGMAVTEQTKVLRMVNTDRLWLEAYAETSETLQLGIKGGEPAWVLMDLPGRARIVEGRVLYVSPVADSVSQTRRVRVEIENPGGLPAGTQARVRLTRPGPEWSAFGGGGLAGTLEPSGAAAGGAGR